VTPPQQSTVAYWELFGSLERSQLRPAGDDAVVLSNIEHGLETSPAAKGLTVRYVARGCENYRIGGRGYGLKAGQIMIAPHESGADCEVKNVEREGTLGVCTLLRGATNDLDWVYGPLVVGAGCSSIGALMQDSARSLWTSARPKQEVASKLVARLRSELPAIARAMLAQAASMDAAKLSTRFEMVRRAHLAQAYLHSVIERAVDLAEVAAAVGYSQFQLLRAFQHCFGERPASYHRKLRLNLALDEARRRRVPLGSVCDEFGFAGASSFSHAYRRAFGHAPVWSRRDAA
jgi:AraC-like DNA-binding protein